MRFILKSGISIPALGLGTYKLTGEAASKIAITAFNKGCQLIDTATAYNNHKDIARALVNFKRSDIFICTKINEHDLHKSSTEDVCDKILQELNISYIDTILLHSPFKNYALHLQKLIDIKKSGKIRSVGVSNFDISHLENIKELLTHIDINQIEFHPYLNQIDLSQYCLKHKIHIMAYRPFAKDNFLNDATLIHIAKLYQKSVRQIALRWLVQKGISVIPKTSNDIHLLDNINIFDFVLKDDHLAMIDSLNQNLKTCPFNPKPKI